MVCFRISRNKHFQLVGYIGMTFEMDNDQIVPFCNAGIGDVCRKMTQGIAGIKDLTAAFQKRIRIIPE